MVAAPLCVVVVDSMPQGEGEQESVQLNIALAGPLNATADNWAVMPGLTCETLPVA